MSALLRMRRIAPPPLGLPNTADKLRSGAASSQPRGHERHVILQPCAESFVSFIRLFGRPSHHKPAHRAKLTRRANGRMRPFLEGLRRHLGGNRVGRSDQLLSFGLGGELRSVLSPMC